MKMLRDGCQVAGIIVVVGAAEIFCSIRTTGGTVVGQHPGGGGIGYALEEISTTRLSGLQHPQLRIVRRPAVRVR